MTLDNTLTIGKIIEKTDEKSKIFADIHYRIVSLISASTGNENIEEIRTPIELLTEHDVYNNGKPSDFNVREIYKRAFIFLNELDRNKAKAAAMTGTHKIDEGCRNALRQNKDLTLLNETYKAFDMLNNSAAYKSVISYFEKRMSYEETERARKSQRKSAEVRREKTVVRADNLEPIKQIICDLYKQELGLKNVEKITATKFRSSIRKRIQLNELTILNLNESEVTDAEIEEWIKEINRK